MKRGKKEHAVGILLACSKVILESSVHPVTVGLSLVFVFIVLLILMILLWCYKMKKEKQQKSSQTSEQIQSRPGDEDSQSGHNPLQTGNEHLYAAVDQADTSGADEAAAESIEDTCAQDMKKKKAKKNNGADAELGMNDVTYAEIQLKPMKKEKKAQEKTSVGDDTVYSELHQNMK